MSIEIQDNIVSILIRNKYCFKVGYTEDIVCENFEVKKFLFFSTSVLLGDILSRVIIENIYSLVLIRKNDRVKLGINKRRLSHIQK